MLKEQVSRVGTRVGLSGFGWFLSQAVGWLVGWLLPSGIDLGNYISSSFWATCLDCWILFFSDMACLKIVVFECVRKSC